MSAPPQMLDGARVKWWAWSGETPFGELFGAEGDDRWVYGFAICRYETGHTYRFTCNKHWDVIQDSDHGFGPDAEEGAKSAIPMNYDASRVAWQKYSI